MSSCFDIIISFTLSAINVFFKFKPASLNQNEKYYISLSLNLYVADNNKLHQKDEPPDNAKSEYEKYYHHCAVYSYRHMGISGEYISYHI